MGRPEWILVFVVLSVGLVGVVAPAAAGSGSAGSDAALGVGQAGPASGSTGDARIDHTATQEGHVELAGEPSRGTLAESRSVTWTGAEQFTDRHRRTAFQIQSGDGSGDDASMLWLLGGGLIGLLLVTVLVVTRYGGLPRGGESGERGAGTASSRGQPVTESAGKTDEPDVNANESAAISPEEPLADDQRVIELLEGGGGRMKQTAIVEETGWSKSKVSMLLSEMEDDGRIKKIQVGRENIIALDGHEPEAASSPFDDGE